MNPDNKRIFRFGDDQSDTETCSSQSKRIKESDYPIIIDSLIEVRSEELLEQPINLGEDTPHYYVTGDGRLIFKGDEDFDLSRKELDPDGGRLIFNYQKQLIAVHPITYEEYVIEKENRGKNVDFEQTETKESNAEGTRHDWGFKRGKWLAKNISYERFRNKESSAGGDRWI